MHSPPEHNSARTKSLWRGTSPYALQFLLFAAAFGLNGVSLFIRASKQTLWHDDLVGYLIVRQASFSNIMDALRSGTDSMPPAFYAMIKTMSVLLPSNLELALRLPSLVGYLVSLFAVYKFCAYRLPKECGLAAVALLASGPLRGYAFETRPYTWIMAFLALAAVCWQRTENGKRYSLLLFVSLTAATLSHHLAATGLICFGLAEFAENWWSKRLRWRVWLAIGLAGVPTILSLPLLQVAQNTYGAHYWIQPSYSNLVISYAFYLGINQYLATLLLLLTGWFGLRWLLHPGEGGLSIPDRFLALSLFAYASILVIATVALHGGYFPRYGWPSALGIAYLAAAIVALFPAATRRIIAVAMGLNLMGLAVMDARRFATRPAPILQAQAQWEEINKTLQIYPQLDLAISNALVASELEHYGSPQPYQRTVYPYDIDLAVRYVGSDSLDRTVERLSARGLLHGVPWAQFAATRARFLLHVKDTAGWMKPHLLAKGHRLTLLSEFGYGSIYLVEPPLPDR